MIAVLQLSYKLIGRFFCLCILVPSALADVPLADYTTAMDDFLQDCGDQQAISAVSTEDMPALLQWIDAEDNACGGYFRPAKPPSEIERNSNTVHFQAKQTSRVGMAGVSYLQGDVDIRYQGGRLNADKSCFFRAQHAEENTAAFAEGNVRFQRDALLVLADKVLWYVQGGEYLHQAYYSYATPGKGVGAAWGYAEDIWREDTHVVAFRDVSYSHCGVKAPIWQIKAHYLSIDQEHKQGFLSDGVLHLFGWPVLYMPVFSFPIDNTRKSGFLYPRFDYSNTGGWHVKIPYYWNLAPNYDLLTSWSTYEKRGDAWTGVWRFLTERLSGEITFMQWFHDSVFNRFKTEMADTYVGNTDPAIQILEESLLAAPLNRQFFAYEHHYTLNTHMHFDAHFDWLSDDYLRDDFNTVTNMLPTRKLPRNATLTYNDHNWLVRLSLQDDRVLQPLNQSILQGVFKAVPSFDVAHYISDFGMPNVEFTEQFHALRFKPASGMLFDTAAVDDTNVEGTRIFYHPSLIYRFIQPWYRHSMQMDLHAQWYNWLNNSDNSRIDHFMFVPAFSDAYSWKFQQDHSSFVQLISPRIMFVYIPYRNQDDLLVLDSTLPVDTYEQLFAVNRFTGADRVGDTTAISMAVENTLIGHENANSNLRIAIGKNYAFSYHKVCLSDDCIGDVQASNHWSPWQLKVALHKGILDSHLVWAIQNDWRKTNSTYFDVTYNGPLNENKIYYNFVRYLEVYPMEIQRSHLIGGESNLVLDDRWNFFASAQYDMANHNVFAYMAGLHYHSCCFESKIGWQHRYTGSNGNAHKLYENNLVFKFYFSGIGGNV